MTIGVFDSGHGGLTVLQALTAALPGHDFAYFGDHAHAPYGDRPPEEIYRLTVAGVERLFARDCRLVVLACNTASAQALRRLQQTWLPHAFPERRVLGVLVPMVEAITGVPWMADLTTGGAIGRLAGEPRRAGHTAARTVAIFATRRTVLSRAYPREIAKRAPEVRVVQQACPSLARSIEADAPPATLRHEVRRYVRALLRKLNGVPPDAAVLGCTHYPLVAELFAEALPPSVELFDQPALCARSLLHYLERHPEFDRIGSGRVEFHTSGDPSRITALATRFYGRPALFAGAGVAVAA